MGVQIGAGFTGGLNGLRADQEPPFDPYEYAEERHRPPADPSTATLERFARLDLGPLLRDDRPEREWLIHGLIPCGAAVSLVAPAGNKKSLFLLAASIAVARGDGAFAGIRITKRRVLYIDMENTEDDLSERLRDLDVHPEDLGRLDNLIVLHLPPLAPLDTSRGAQDLAAIVNAYGLQAGDVVVLDSFQRVTQGPENDSDTTRAYYLHTGMGLKRRGLTVIRTDNTGHAETGRARGSSGKKDDVDIELVLTKINDARFEIKPGKVRISGIESLTVDLLTDEETAAFASTPPATRGAPSSLKHSKPSTSTASTRRSGRTNSGRSCAQSASQPFNARLFGPP
jgi:hypothetical protein